MLAKQKISQLSKQGYYNNFAEICQEKNKLFLPCRRFLHILHKNKTYEKISENLKISVKCVAMRFELKKRITFAWYTKGGKAE